MTEIALRKRARPRRGRPAAGRRADRVAARSALDREAARRPGCRARRDPGASRCVRPGLGAGRGRGAVFALRAIVLPWLLARAVGAEPDEQREATPLVNTSRVTADHGGAHGRRVCGHPSGGRARTRRCDERRARGVRGDPDRTVRHGDPPPRHLTGRRIPDAGQRDRGGGVPADRRGAADRRTRRVPGRAVRADRDRRAHRPAASRRSAAPTWTDCRNCGTDDRLDPGSHRRARRRVGRHCGRAGGGDGPRR